MSINLELRDLRVFLAVYEFKSFREAADLLHLSQPALSRRVQALENTLHVALFERSTRHVLPTAAGRTFEPMARRLLEELDTLAGTIGGGGDQQSGLITIAALPSAAIYFLPRLHMKFIAKFPHTRLRVLDRLVAEGVESVIRGEAEFGINVGDPTEIDLTFSHLLDDPYVFVCHRGHILAGKRRIDWEDLRGHPLIGIGRAADSRNRALFDEALSKANLRLQWRYEVYRFWTALQLIEGGVGSSIMPRLAVSLNRGSNLVTVPIGHVPLSRSIGIIERRNGRLSPPAKFLRDILIAHCGGAVPNSASQKIPPSVLRANRAGAAFARVRRAR
jgi:DNA-binding transcriptional LysR family regulator